jgi:hypothetical protein
VPLELPENIKQARIPRGDERVENYGLKAA